MSPRLGLGWRQPQFDLALGPSTFETGFLNCDNISPFDPGWNSTEKKLGFGNLWLEVGRTTTPAATKG
jgi:hypothetical protein